MIFTWCGSRWFCHDGESGQWIFRCKRRHLESIPRQGQVCLEARDAAAVVTWNDKFGADVWLRECLRDYGAWDDLHKVSLDTIKERIIWIASGDFRERNRDR